MSNTPEPAIHIALSSWITQDGNYGDFTVGHHAKFALEFWWDDDRGNGHYGLACTRESGPEMP